MNVVRKHYQRQHRFDSSPIASVELNLECRDEMIPILLGLQHLYTAANLRMKVVQLVAADLNENSRRDVGRPGMDDWHVIVLAAVRLGCVLTLHAQSMPTVGDYSSELLALWKLHKASPCQ